MTDRSPRFTRWSCATAGTACPAASQHSGSADDVAREICLAVVAALQTYVVSGRSLSSFVHGIAANKVADAFRTIGRNRTEPIAEVPDSPVLHDGPEQRLLAGEFAERPAGLLQSLTPRQRNVLVLRIAVGLTAEETADELRTSPGAVGSPSTVPSAGSALRSSRPAPGIVPPPLAGWLSFASTTLRDSMVARMTHSRS